MAKAKNNFKKNRIKSSGTTHTIDLNKKKHNRKRLNNVCGLFLLLSAIFIFISLSSYIYNYHKYKFIDADSAMINTLLFKDVFLQSDIVIYNVMGFMGAKVAYFFLYNWFGIISYVLVILIFLAGIRILFKRNLIKITIGKLALLIVLFIYIPSVFGFVHAHFKIPSYLSGFFGYQVNKWLHTAIGTLGSILIYLFIATIIFIINVDCSELKFRIAKTFNIVKGIIGNVANLITKTIHIGKKTNQKKLLTSNNLKADCNSSSSIDTFKAEAIKGVKEEALPTTEDSDSSKYDDDGILKMEVNIAKADETISNVDFNSTIYDPCLDLNNYNPPTLDLLNKGNTKIQFDNSELDDNKRKIISSLKHYGIEISTIKATVGPTITLYEIVPAPGVRVSKIKSLEDDIALSLSALGIRIIAPIPGKGTVGIEVPNRQSELVTMHSILATEKYINSKAELPIALGKTISNEVYIEDLAKMPHLLIAGATGQGKSVGINAVITSLIYKKHPAELKFVLVDPKKVELSLFSKLEKHFLAKIPGEADPIITDTKKVIYTLKSLCVEMDQRYNLLTDAGVRHITEYNKKFTNKSINPNKGHRYLPYIVLVIDEFADLILTAGKEVESSIARLAQLARAVGIHLIIATQRPSVNVITGLIKANFPARLAFKVISKVDSRTILDSSGADQLIGKGDMLFSYGSNMVRLQCSYLSVEEVDGINSFIGSQQGYFSAYELPEVVEGISEDDPFAQDTNNEGRDPLFVEAARLVVINKNASTSSIQRKLQLGYNRAGRIMDQLEAAGIVGSQNGSKARELKIRDEYSLAELFERLNIK